MVTKYALIGRVATIDDAFRVLEHGSVYVDGERIVAVSDATEPPPAGFEVTKRTETHGTLFPGLIELHNHLAYDALPPWPVPKRYGNRDEWGGGGVTAYRALISGPMQVLGHSDAMPALIRYVEAKCLLGGVTTSQGIELYSNHGARRYYKGVVRNVEQTDDATLPEALTKISDVEASKITAFVKKLHGSHQLILHLAEGTDDAARRHFLALKLTGEEWAITDRLVGIHCAALQPADFAVLASHGGAMVWSPLSNLLLYGKTARLDAALASGVPVALGSDWAPSGSKNLLAELKVARAAAPSSLADRELVAMATRGAARILRWDSEVGSLTVGRRADLIVVRGSAGDPYKALLAASEDDLHLVCIGGTPRLGTATMMKSLGATGETVTIGGVSRVVNLKDPAADDLVAPITLAAARTALRDAFRDLPALALAQEKERQKPRAARADAAAPTRWFLALDEVEPTGMELRPRLAKRGTKDAGPRIVSSLAAAKPLSQILHPMVPDPLTVADDPRYFEALRAQKNLPDGFVDQLEAMTG